MGVKNRTRVYEIPDNIEYIIAKPRMKLYMEYSARIYGIYLKYIAPDDIHIYSIDECFIDLTCYIKVYNKSAREICQMITQDILDTVGITATVGIGENMFLAKVALDIMAKHSPDFIAYLDKEVFDKEIARYRPITDIWGIGQGIANRLAYFGIYDLTKNNIKQLDLFIDEASNKKIERDKNLQNLMLAINKKYGKNSLLRARALTEKSTIIRRNKTIGGHNA